MKKITYVCFILCLSTAFFAELKAQETPEEKVERMLELTGSKQQFDMVITQMIDLQRDGYGSILGDDFFNEFEKRAKDEGFAEISKGLTPVYLKHFSAQEIDALIKFYESDIGKSLVEKTPMIMKESMAIGAEWGRKIGEEIVGTIRAEALNSELQSKFNSKLEEDCSRFKIGKFYYYTDEHSKIEVVRTADRQIEKENGEESEMKIQWLSNSRYAFTNMKEIDPNLPSDTLTVNIYEATENSYKFVAKMEGIDYYYEQELFMEK